MSSGAEIVLEHQEAAGVAGGAATAGWNTRKLKVTVDSHGLLSDQAADDGSLPNNEFVLPAGTWEIVGWATAFKVNAHRIRLSAQGGAYTVLGGSGWTSNAGDYGTSNALIQACFNFLRARKWKFEHYCGAAQAAATAFGVPVNIAGLQEVYASITLKKMA